MKAHVINCNAPIQKMNRTIFKQGEHMRKVIVAIALITISTAAHSARCCVNGAQCANTGNNTTFTANATVQATDAGNTIRIDGYNLSCQFQFASHWPESYTDFWRTSAPVLTPAPIFASYRTGLTIRGTNYLNPVSSGILVASIPNISGLMINLQTYMYVQKQGGPGTPINIQPGDHLGRIRFRQTNNYDGSSTNVTLELNAANRLVIEPSTCTINGNRAIEIDFKDVSPNELGSDPITSTIRKTERLTYSCPDPGITTPINITFRGDPAVFDGRVLATSNNLGTGMIRAGALVAPNSSFLTNIINSTGGDDVTFTLVHNPAVPPATGAFTASGTLVMSTP